MGRKQRAGTEGTEVARGQSDSRPLATDHSSELARIEYISLRELQRAARNPKGHDLGALHESHERFGFVRPLLRDERTGRLVFGHGNLDELQRRKASGEAPPRRVQVRDGEWYTPVICGIAFESDEEAEAYLLADNRMTELGGWDEPDLTEMLADIVTRGEGALRGIGWDEEDLDRKIADLAQGNGAGNTAEDPGPQIDRAEELREKWATEQGQLWEVGRHRIVCGDCTDRSVVERVMGGEQVDMIWTDPPYGHRNNDDDLIARREKALGQKEKDQQAQRRPILNDSIEDSARVFSALCRIAADLLSPGHCCCCGGGGGPDPQFARWSLELDEAVGLKQMVVWDKGGLGMGWHYRRCYETVLVAENPGAATHWFGGHDVPNIIRDIGKIIPTANQHPTEKPVELVEWFLRLHSQPGETVLDPFLGSGTSLVACEKLGRLGRGIEIEPKFGAVALERLARMSLEPHLG